MTIRVIFLVLFATAITYTIMVYFRNKQKDRTRHRRERLQEKQEEIMESLRNRSQQQKKDDEN